jgi:hypothetical protein
MVESRRGSDRASDPRRLLPDLHEQIERHRIRDVHRLRDSVGELEPGDTVSACALAAAACETVLGVRLHDPQLLASLALAEGVVVEMRTGEGKTFAAIGPALLFAKQRGQVHVVTANPYLAERDAAWSGKVLETLGLKVGVTLPGRDRATTRGAYLADVVYGAGSDFGFDFLRDQLVLPEDPPVQRGHHAAIVDEIDAVLIDGATTPLVLSGTTPIDKDAVHAANHAVATLLSSPDVDGVAFDSNLGRVELTDAGIDAVERQLGVDNLFGGAAIDWPHLLNTALRAHVLLRRDRDYIVRDDGAIGVVDELTGRVLPGRRWSEGLHQAVEAKEGVALTFDRRPLGRVTVGSYFSRYDLLVGMSGTLEGAQTELLDVYGLHTLAIPTHQAIRRVEHADLEVADEAAKFAAVADDTAARHRRGQPVLVGTVSIAQAAHMSSLLDARSIPHRVLTARNDAAEAEVIAAAGRRSAVTVATQMAGRGVDIIVDAGESLMVWGVEHHASRRLDGQLSGRTGRQGAPGEARYAVAADEPLLEVADSVHAAQLRLEQLEAAARDDVRALDGPVDMAHDHLYEWRLRAADPAHCRLMLQEGLSVVSRNPLETLLALSPVSAGLTGSSRRRDRELVTRLERAIEARSREVSTDTWDLIASAVLRRLLLDLWTDTLERLESDKELERISHLFGVQRRAWLRKVEARYAAFRLEAQRAWVIQLLSMQLVDEPYPSTRPATDVGPSPIPDPAHFDHDESAFAFGDWTGPSYNKFWRRHASLVPPDPPLVLVLDAIGDPTPGTISVHLDHDDPSQSLVVLPRN